MYVNPDPIPIDPKDPNAGFLQWQQMQELMFNAQCLSFVSRDGAIQNNDKAGNFNAVWLVFTSNGAPNTEDVLVHHLGHVPLGFIPALSDKAAIIYDSGTAWTSTNLYVKTSVASVAWKLLVF